MPKITCGVVTCAYNKSKRCVKSVIDVDGPFARYKNDTCCDSFIEGDLPSFNYEFAHFEPVSPKNTEISCDVASCIYMSRGKCSADEIEIRGRTASENYETDCETFHCR
jgi:hypothetical protein